MKMNMEDIRALAAIVKENGLESLTLSEGNWSLSIKMPTPQVVAAAASAPVAVAPAGPASVTVTETAASSSSAKGEGSVISSPMVGVFYSAPSPESEPFVKVGDQVKKGDVVCIIEAMKLMNEIQAEKDGQIAEICVENGQVVEFGQSLFRLV